MKTKMYVYQKTKISSPEFANKYIGKLLGSLLQGAFEIVGFDVSRGYFVDEQECNVIYIECLNNVEPSKYLNKLFEVIAKFDNAFDKRLIKKTIEITNFETKIKLYLEEE